MDSFIPDSSTWIFDEPGWDSWHGQDASTSTSRLLVLEGPPGAGKSHLAASVYDRLAERSKQSVATCVVHFYFREAAQDMNYLSNAVSWTVIQIADQDANLCEKINIEIQREDIDYWDGSDWQQTWKRLIKPFFGGQNAQRLQIVWDGLDELERDQRGHLVECLKTMTQGDDLKISIFCTTRPILREPLRELGASIVQATKEKQLPDMRILIWKHLDNDSGLRKFSRYTKQRVSTALEEHADGMLYVEHMLRRCNLLGREHFVLSVLDQSMPQGLEKLYESMATDLQCATLSSQAAALIGLDHFDLERALQRRRLASFVKIADSPDRTVSPTEAQDMDEWPALGVAEQGVHTVASNDNILPLRFQERSMRQFFRDAKLGEIGLRTPASLAHQKIFHTCALLICQSGSDVPVGLKKYAARYWAMHLNSIKMEELRESDVAAALDALGGIMSNEHNVAAGTIETLGVEYQHLVSSPSEPQNDLPRQMMLYARLAQNPPRKVSTLATTWAKTASSDGLSAFMLLAEGHVRNWLSSEDLKSALQSYRFARSALKLTYLSHILKDRSEQDEDSSDDDGSETSGEGGYQSAIAPQQVYDVVEIVGILQSFSNEVKTDAKADWCVAAVLEHSKHHNVALEYAQRALDLGECPRLRSRTLNLLAQIYMRTGQVALAKQQIDRCLTGGEEMETEMPPQLRRDAHVTCAKIRYELDDIDGALSAYQEARKAYPSQPMSGVYLQNEFDIVFDKKNDTCVLDLVRQWTPLERLAWMTWGYDDDGDDQHEYFQKAAGRLQEQGFMVQVYIEVIKLLENINAAAPIRYQLAWAQWRVCGDVAAAKASLNEILDSPSNGQLYAFTNEDPAYTLKQTILLMTDIAYDQFRATSDPQAKADLLAEVQGLAKRQFTLSIANAQSEQGSHYVVVARMKRKMAQAQEFQESLERAFDSCYESLVDNVGWNDLYNLGNLALVLSNLKGLDREAQILISAQFSELDPTVTDHEVMERKVKSDSGSAQSHANESHTASSDEDDDDGDNDHDATANQAEHNQDSESGSDESDDSDDSDESLPPEQGDLADCWFTCDGECRPEYVWDAWKHMPMFVCVICCSTGLCEDCYLKRQAYNNQGDGNVPVALVGMSYCGKNHRYIKGPIEGWKGVKDGIMTIEAEGEQPIKVKFRDWLEDLKVNKWKAAWERFWLEED